MLSCVPTTTCIRRSQWTFNLLGAFPIVRRVRVYPTLHPPPFGDMAMVSIYFKYILGTLRTGLQGLFR